MKTNNFLKSYHCDIVDFFFGGVDLICIEKREKTPNLW